MLTIDGSYGEGGGQVLRTSLALSALLGRELRIEQIRAGRSKPGLAPQHLASVHATAGICGATVTGDRLGSQELTFIPGELRGGRHRLDVGTAGATTLVLQTILPALLFAADPSSVQIHGGTNVPWSPPQEYIAQVFLPALAAMGAEVRLDCMVPGFYPKGGGCIEARMTPLSAALTPLEWSQRGQLRSLVAYSVAEARLPGHILKRQVEGARAALGSIGLRAETWHPHTLSPGTMLTIAASFERGRGGFSAIGMRGKSAEEVGAEAGERAASFLGGSASVDRHLGDQLLLYAALAGGTTSFVTEEVTEHLRTNAWVIREFLEVQIEINEDTGVVTVAGLGMPAAARPGRER
ncbi:MAG: RNA 3'-terminal phosphate cyclase [candidate division WS1 bacterium]|jgi:RNA 3'-phosphate cyclase|nr:RNA 3'-terminal phosphate cyclase [candidate division WS1 bacterium]